MAVRMYVCTSTHARQYLRMEVRLNLKSYKDSQPRETVRISVGNGDGDRQAETVMFAEGW